MKHQYLFIARGFVILLVGLYSVNTSSGQKTNHQARPLKGSPSIELPSYTSLDAYVNGREATGFALMNEAEYAGSLKH